MDVYLDKRNQKGVVKEKQKTRGRGGGGKGGALEHSLHVHLM